MNWNSLVIGGGAFIIIGIFHPIVIKTEYYVGKRIWPLFLICGLVCLTLALMTWHMFFSPILSITGFTWLWSIQELWEQEKRVQKGWFPRNPKNM